MRSQYLPLKSKTACLDNTARRIYVPSARLFRRAGVIMVFAGLLVSAFYSASSAKTAKVGNSAQVSRDQAKTGASVKSAERLSPKLNSSFNPPLAPLPQSLDSSLATYDSDCSTSKTTFAVGETVCVKASGFPVGSFFPRYMTWATPDSTIVRSTQLFSDPQDDSLLLTATTSINGLTIDNRGTWQVVVRNPFFFFPEAIVRFTVTDPANAAADLSVASTFVPSNVQVGSNAGFGFQLSNYGPNAATNVQFSNPAPAGSSLVSLQQLSGPAFVCSGANCSIASLAAGAEAIFLATVMVNSGTELTDTASVSSTTSDPVSGNNSSSVTVAVAADTGSLCTITCPADIVTNNDPGTAGHIIPAANFPAPSTSGTCGTVSTTVSPNPQTNEYFFAIGTSFVTAFTDTGDTCTFTVTVNDVENPTITCPADISTFESPAGSGFKAVNFTVNAADNSGQATVTCDHPSGFSFPLGTTQVTCHASDNADNVSPDCTFNVTVDPVTGDCVLTTQPAIVVNSDANACGTHVTFNTPTTASGNCGTVTCDHASGSFFGEGDTLVTCTSHPDGANTSFTVTVNDTTAPVPDLSSLPTITKDCTANAGIPVIVGGHTVFEPPTASDNCGGHIEGATNDPRVYQDPGTFIVHWTYTDASGNTSSQDQTINVTGTDTTPPVPDVATLPTITDECSATVPSAPTATDDCDGTLTGTTPDPLTYTGAGTYTVHWTYTDQTGHAVNQNQTVIVTDTHAPTIALVGASNITVECHTSFSDQGVTTTDNCVPKNVNVTTAGSVNVNVPNIYTLTYTATDGGGNQASVQRTVTVVDTIAPVITLNAPTSVPPVECHTLFTDPGATATDTCDTNVPVTVSGTVDVNTPGTYVLTYNATDDSGNQADPVQRTVTVVDTTAPIITVNGNTLSMWPPNHKYRTFGVTGFVTGVTDSCDTTLGIGSVVIEKVTSDEIENGNGDGNTLNDIVIAADCRSVQLRAEREGNSDGRVYTITFSVTDASGNVGTATAKVVVPHNTGQTPVDSGPHYTVSCGGL